MSALSDALNAANVDGLSVREIARRGGDRVHHSALGKYFKPVHGRPSEEALEVFSEVLRIPLPKLRELAGMPAGEESPYRPPAEANRLTARQRKLVDELIRMLAETKAGDGDVERTAAPMNAEWSVEIDGVTVGVTGAGRGFAIAGGIGALPDREHVVQVLEQAVEVARQSGPDVVYSDVDLTEDVAARTSTE